MYLLNLILQAAAPEALPVNPDSAKVAVKNFAENLASNPSAALENLIQSGIQFGLKVLAALAIYLVGAWLIRRVRSILNKVFERKGSDAALASFVGSFVSIALTVILVIITVGTLGVNTSSLAALLAAGGMAIGMALSGTVQNFAGGLMIMIFKPFRAGDFIEAQGFTGTVTEVTIVSTRLTTLDNRSIVIPNGALSNGNINNFSHNPLRRVDWTVNVEYGSDVQLCQDTLLELVKADSRVIDASVPGAADPFVALAELGPNGIAFTVRAWVKSEDYWDVFFAFNKTVYSEFPKRGIHFPFPQLDVRVRKDA